MPAWHKRIRADSLSAPQGRFIGHFFLHVTSGTGLAPHTRHHTADPYVIAHSHATRKTCKSSIAKETLDPVWGDEQMFTFDVVSFDDEIGIEVWHKNHISFDSFMGHASVLVHEAPEDGRYTHRSLELVPDLHAHKSAVVCGAVEVKFRFEPNMGHKGLTASSPICVDPKPNVSDDGPLILEVGEAFTLLPARALRSSPLAKPALENPREEVMWYRRMFADREHNNFVLQSEKVGSAIFLSVLVTCMNEHSGLQYWVVVWLPKGPWRQCVDVPFHNPLSFFDLLRRIDPTGNLKIYANRKLFWDVTGNGEVVQRLLDLEDGKEHTAHAKIGVVFAQQGQTTDDEMLSNEHPSPALDEFLCLLGDRVRLKGFEGFHAQLDTKNDADGTHSVYRNDIGGYELMFHVSALLHFDQTDPQRVQRKRHIGNDIAVIVFMEGDTPYNANALVSQFTNVIAVVQPSLQDPHRYRVAIGRKKGLREFGPPPAVLYPKDDSFSISLITSCLNGVDAAKRSAEFLSRLARTNKILQDDLCKKCEDSEHRHKPKELVLPQPYSSIPRHLPQAFVLETVDGEFVGRPTCCALAGTVFLIGCATERGDDPTDGVYAFDPAKDKAPRGPIAKLSHVQQITVLPSPGKLPTVLVRMGGTLPFVRAFPLEVLLRNTCSINDSRIVPSSAKATLVATGKIGRDTYVGIAADDAVSVCRVTSRGFDHVEELVVRGHVTALIVTSRGFVVGSSPLPLYSHDEAAPKSSEPARFTYFTVDGFHPTRLHTAAENQTRGVHAIAAFARDDGGLLLCYDDVGIVIKEDGYVDRTSRFEWTGHPLHFDTVSGGPEAPGVFLLVVYYSYMEVRSLQNGALVETHWGFFERILNDGKRGMYATRNVRANPLAVEAEVVNHRDKFNRQLHHVVEAGKVPAATALLRRGVDPNCVGRGGKLPLHVAIEKDHPEVVAVLLQYGASPLAKTEGGASPLEMATPNSTTRRLIYQALRLDPPSFKPFEPPLRTTAFSLHLMTKQMFGLRGAASNVLRSRMMTPTASKSSLGGGASTPTMSRQQSSVRSRSARPRAASPPTGQAVGARAGTPLPTPPASRGVTPSPTASSHGDEDAVSRASSPPPTPPLSPPAVEVNPEEREARRQARLQRTTIASRTLSPEKTCNHIRFKSWCSYCQDAGSPHEMPVAPPRTRSSPPARRSLSPRRTPLHSGAPDRSFEPPSSPRDDGGNARGAAQKGPARGLVAARRSMFEAVVVEHQQPRKAPVRKQRTTGAVGGFTGLSRTVSQEEKRARIVRNRSSRSSPREVAPVDEGVEVATTPNTSPKPRMETLKHTHQAFSPVGSSGRTVLGECPWCMRVAKHRSLDQRSRGEHAGSVFECTRCNRQTAVCESCNDYPLRNERVKRSTADAPRGHRESGDLGILDQVRYRPFSRDHVS